MSNIPFQINRKRGKDILVIVHTDICGSFQTIGYKG